MRVLFFIFICLTLSSCKSTPKKSTITKGESLPVPQTKVNNVNIAFIKSQILNIEGQIFSVENSIIKARAKLINATNPIGSNDYEAMVLSAESEIASYQVQKNSLEARKLGSDSIQKMSIHGQIQNLESSILSAQVRLDNIKQTKQHSNSVIATDVQSEITNYQLQKDNLQAHKKELEIQLILNQ